MQKLEIFRSIPRRTSQLQEFYLSLSLIHLRQVAYNSNLSPSFFLDDGKKEKETEDEKSVEKKRDRSQNLLTVHDTSAIKLIDSIGNEETAVRSSVTVLAQQRKSLGFVEFSRCISKYPRLDEEVAIAGDYDICGKRGNKKFIPRWNTLSWTTDGRTPRRWFIDDRPFLASMPDICAIYVLWEILARKRLESFLDIPWHGRNREISRDLSLHFCAVTLDRLYGSVLHSRTRFISDRVVSRTSIVADYYIVAWRSRRRSLRSTVSENTIDFSIWYFWVNFEEVSWMFESFIDGRMTSRILCSTWEC